MKKRLARQSTIARYLTAFDNKWLLVDDMFDCDICQPLLINEINEFIKGHKAGEPDQPPPWFCEMHAREWNLLW